MTAKYRPDIDGLRAVSILSVVCYHCGVPWITGGFVGVDIFFVISGFLISGLIVDEVSTGSFSFLHFYSRRAKRILPALFCCLAVMFLFALLVLTPRELSFLSSVAVRVVLAISNIDFWLGTKDYFNSGADQNALLMTWSLGVEEQFYLFFPALVVIVLRYRPAALGLAIAALGVVSFLLCIYTMHVSTTAAFYLTPQRTWEFSAGALAVLASKKYGALAPRPATLLGAAGLATLAACDCFMTPDTVFPGVAALAPVAGAVMVICSGQGWINRRVLSSKPLVFIGLISYSWYLWHWPFLSFARIASPHALSRIAATAIGFASLIPAVLSWRFVERPFRRSGISDARVLIRSGLVTVSLVAIFFLSSKMPGFPKRFSPEVASIEALHESDTRQACMATYRRPEPKLTPPCVPGDGRPAIALVGDSHAVALAPAIKDYATRQGMAFWFVTKASCPYLVSVTRSMPENPQQASECASFQSKVTDLLKSPAVKTVILVGFWDAPFIDDPGNLANAHSGQRYLYEGADAAGRSKDGRSLFETGLANSMDLLSKAGKRVIVVQDVPLLAMYPLKHLLLREIPVRRLLSRLVGGDDGRGDSTDRADLLSDAVATRETISDVAKRYGAVVLDPTQNLCDGMACRFSDGSKSYYIDPQHLSQLGARVATQGLLR